MARKFEVVGPSRVRINDGKRTIIGYEGDIITDVPPRAAAVLLEAGDLKEIFEKPAPPAKAAKKTAPKKTKAQKKEEKKAVAAKWPLKTPPSEYLEKYPKGPKAALAREILGTK